MLYEGYTFYGPYLCKDKRLRLILRQDGINRTLSYPKYVMEIHLGRYLKDNEEVHHIDENPLNNEIYNLEILTQITHKKKHIQIEKEELFICPNCEQFFTLKGRKLSSSVANKLQGKSGPFCSKSCVGKWSTR